MATQYTLDGSLPALKAVLDQTDYFDEVTLNTVTSQGNGDILCMSGDLAFRLGGYTQASSSYWVIGAGIVGSAVTTYTRDSNSYDNPFDYRPAVAYACEKGISILCDRGRILITKNNSGKTVVAFGENSPTRTINDPAEKTAAVMNTICAIADGDADTYRFFINNCSSYTYTHRRLYNQTLIIPIPTQAGFGTVSYTDHAGLLLLPQTLDVCNFTYNGKRYFSDGYFVIEDGEETT